MISYCLLMEGDGKISRSSDARFKIFIWAVLLYLKPSNATEIRCHALLIIVNSGILRGVLNKCLMVLRLKMSFVIQVS